MNIKKNSKSNILHIAFAIILIASTFLSLAYQANAVACKVDSPKCCEDGQCGVNQGTINPSKFIRGEAYYKGEECREGVPENCNEDDPDDPRCSVSCDCPPNTKPAREIRYPQADSVQDACKCIKSTSEEYYGQINCCGNEDDDCGRSNNGRYLCVMQRSISQKARISDAISNIGDSVDAPCDGTTYLGTGDRWLECENGFFTPLPENRGPNEFISPGNPKVVRVKEHEYLCRGFGPKSIVECCGTSLANCQSKDSSIVRLIAGQSVIPSAFQSRPRPTPPFTLAVYEDTTNQQTPPTPTPTPTPAPTPTPSGSCNDGNLDPSEDCDMPNYPCGDPDTERCSSCRCVPRRGSQVNQEVDYQVITVNPITGLATGITGDVTSITGMQTATTLTIRVGETKELGEWAITTTAVVEDTLKITFFYQDSAPLTQRKIYIIGIRAGQTTITIRSGSGSTIRTYSVTVQEPLSCTPGQQPLQCTGPNNCQGTQTCQSGIWGTCVCTATNPTTTSSTPSTTPPPSNIGNRIFVAMDLPNKLNDFYLDNSGRDCQIYAKEEDRINRDDKCGANANYGKIISRNGRLSDGVSTYWGDCNEDAKVVMRKGFGDNEYVNDDNCGNCLLQLSKGVYKPKGDLLCGYDGNWYLCNSAYHGGTDKFFNSGNSRYKCTPNNEWQLVGSSTPTSTPTPSTCGNNNQRENNEDCDGTNLNNKRCQDIDSAFTGGTLTCYPNTAGSNACKFDTSRCTSTQSQPPTTQARRECGTSSPIGSCDASPGPIQYESEVRAAINNVRSANPGGLMSKRNDDLNAINDYINRVISQLESRGFEARKVKNCNDKESADAIIVRRRTGTSGSGSVVAADSITGQVAGITGLTTHPGRVRGVVWIDSDQDGIKDGNEQWKSEVDVRLEDERNNNALFRNMMNTNNNGAYQYDNLPVRGGYRLKILIPQGYEKVNTRPSPCPSQAICSGGDDSIGFSIDSAGQEREYNLAIKSSSGTTPTPPPTTNNQGPEYYGIIINIWSGRTLGDTANIGYIEKASWNRALPQNHVYGSNIIYYCREDGTFTINLDAPGITKQGSPGAVDRNKNLCEGIGSPWLGTRCCGEPGVCEYHNEAGKDKACWTATPTRQNIDLFENNAVILYGGNFHGCAIDKTNFFPNNNVLLKLFDKGTNNELITNHDYCFNIDQRNYYCSFNETWVPTEGRDKTRLSYAPPQDNSQSTNQITGRVTAINPITGQVAGITGLTTHPGKVKGVVYVDSNQNGVKDSNEQGKSEVDVKIEDTTNNRALFGPTNTPNSGAYEFNNVPVRGNYRIVFEVPQGYRVVSPKPSSCNSEDGCSNLGAAGTSFSIDRAGQERVYNLAIVQSSTTTTTTTTNNAQREMAAECCAATECWNGTSCIASQRNNPTAQPLRNHRCIDGEWKRAVLKCAPAGEPCGFCSDESMCMLNPLSNNPETQCVSNEYYSADNYCDNGIWSTRTKILALKLLAMRSSNDDFTLFCDTKENTLNNLVYVTDSGELASSIITSLNANNFCILKAGNKVIVGTSINSDISQIRGGFNIFGVTSCSNARDDNRYYACDASNKVWYNKKLKSIIYSTSQISVPSAQESSSSLSDSIRNIINRIKALINPPPFDESYVNSIKRFDKLYLAKKDSRTIRGALDGTDFKNAVVEYGNFRTNICSYTDSFNRAGRQSLSGISCRKEGDNYYVLVQGSQFASLNPEQIWPDLTAKLRLT